MKTHREPTRQQERRDLLDGRAFLRMQANKTPLRLIASVANVTEAEVRRLLKLVEDDAAK